MKNSKQDLSSMVKGKQRINLLNQKVVQEETLVKNKGGRPKKQESDKRMRAVHVYFTVDERASISEHANKRGLTMGGFVRNYLKTQGLC